VSSLNVFKCCLPVSYPVHTSKWWMKTEEYCTRDQTVHFAYVTSLRTEGKQAHILHKLKTSPDTASHKVLPRGNIVNSLDSTCFLTCYPSHPSDHLASSNGRGTHGFVPRTVNTFFYIRVAQIYCSLLLFPTFVCFYRREIDQFCIQTDQWVISTVGYLEHEIGARFSKFVDPLRPSGSAFCV
jgi:hypothetical protein